MKKTLALLLAVALIAFSGCNTHKNDAIYSENFSADRAMFSYYLNAEYINFINANKDSLSDYSLDTSTPLSEQTCSLTGDTWFEYFADSATDRLERYLILSEKARDEKKEISAEGQKKADTALATMKTVASDEGKSFENYLSENFGEEVDEKAVKKCLEMEFLAEDYYNEYVNSLKADESVFENYYKNNIKDFAKVDFLYTLIEADPENSITDEGYQTAIKLSNATTADEFSEICEDYFYDYFLEKYGENAKDKAKTSAKKQMENVENLGVYYDGTTVTNWAFSKGLKAGDTKIIKDSENAYYYVMYLLKEPYREDYKAVNMRQIMFGNGDNAEKNAKDCLKQLEDCKFNLDTFNTLCKKYTIDEQTKETGGTYSGINKETLADADEIETFLFDTTRKADDYKLIKTEKYGWHIVYFESYGEEVWLTSVKAKYYSYKFNIYIENLADDVIIRTDKEVINSVTETEQ